MIGERKQEENKEDGRRVVKGTQDAVEVDCGGGIDTYIHYMLCIVKVVKSYTKFFFQCEILESIRMKIRVIYDTNKLFSAFCADGIKINSNFYYP